MKLIIKNMVSIRCKMIVKSVLEKMQMPYANVQLGEVEVFEEMPGEKKEQFKTELKKFGFELLEDNKSILVEKIKNVVVEMIHYSDEQPRERFSVYLSEKLHHNYTYLSNLFTEVKGITLEHFIITHKIERVKEMLVYDELSLSEIARRLHYSSVAHLSSQFKKITGLKPSHFKKMGRQKRSNLEDL